MAQPGLPLVGGHHHLGALGPRQQLIQGEDGRQGRLSLPSWEHPAGQPRAGPLVPGGGDQGPLPGPQPQRTADTMPTGHPYVVGGEPRNRQLPPRTAFQRQRRGVNGGLRPRLHGANLRP
jgi:hypothetical protein